VSCTLVLLARTIAYKSKSFLLLIHLFLIRNPDYNEELTDHDERFEKITDGWTNEENIPDIALPELNHLHKGKDEEIQESRMLNQETRALTASELLLNK